MVEPYFDVSVVIISFVFLGCYLEIKAKSQTSEEIKNLLAFSQKEQL